MQSKLMKGSRARNQPSCALRGESGKVVTSTFSCCNERLEFIVNRIHEGFRNKIVHNDTAVVFQDSHDIFGGRRLLQCLHLHCSSPSSERVRSERSTYLRSGIIQNEN